MDLKLEGDRAQCL